MSRRLLEPLLWALALLVGVAAWAGVRAAVPDAEDAASAVDVAVDAPPPGPSAGALVAAAGLTAARDPFRLDRRPAEVAFGEEPPPPAPAGPPRAPRPPLAVSAIVGPPWRAALTGVPGRNSVVVRPGDVVGDLRVRAVSSDRVVVEGPDTTWNLVLRRP